MAEGWTDIGKGGKKVKQSAQMSFNVSRSSNNQNNLRTRPQMSNGVGNNNNNNNRDDSGFKRVYTKIYGNLKRWQQSIIMVEVGKFEGMIKLRLQELNAYQVGNISKLWDCLYNMMGGVNSEYCSCEDFKMKYQNHPEIERNDLYQQLVEISKDSNRNLEFISLNSTYQSIYIKIGNKDSPTHQFMHIGLEYYIEMKSGSTNKRAPDNRSVLEELLREYDGNQTSQDYDEAGLTNLKYVKTILKDLSKQQEIDVEHSKNQRNKQYDIFTDEEINEMHHIYECTLTLSDAHSGYAIPNKSYDDLTEQRINLTTRRNCGYNAFDSDEVLVKMHDIKAQTGKVVKVRRSYHTPVYGVYLCKVDQYQTNLMKPLDKFIPKIHVDNTPGQNYWLDQLSKGKSPSSQLSPEQKTVLDNQAESKKYADTKFVSIYNVKVNRNTMQPEFTPKDILEVQLNQQYLYIVVYIDWNINFMYPFGRVVGYINRLTHPKMSIELFQTICHVPTRSQKVIKSINQEIKNINAQVDIDLKNKTPNTNDAVTTLRKQAEDRMPVVSQDQSNPPVVFTMDNEDTTDMDDAISYYCPSNDDGAHSSDGTNNVIHYIGVHIADVTRYLPITSLIYRVAEKQAFTFYSGSEGIDPIQMLHRDLASSTFSLVPNKMRPVISMYFQFEENSQKHTFQLIEERTQFVTNQFIISQARLVYSRVAKVLEGENDADMPDVMIRALRNIHEITKQLRKRRLPHSYFVQQLDKLDAEYNGSTDSSSHQLIEELMLMTNRNVAQQIFKTFPQASLLRCQPPVNNSQRWIENVTENTNRKFASQLNEFFELLTNNGYTQRSNGRSLVISRYFYEHLRLFVSQGKYKEALTLFQADHHYNEFFVHLSEWYHSSCPSKYICSTNNTQLNRHFQLNFDQYTHFTSPIRRFVDIIVHRILKQSLSNANINELAVSQNEIEVVCKNSNRLNACANKFEKYCQSMSRANSGSIAEDNFSRGRCLLLHCAVGAIGEESFEVLHRNLRAAFSTSTIKYSNMGKLSVNPVLNTTNSNKIFQPPDLTNLKLQWKRRIFTMTSRTYSDSISTRRVNVPTNVYDAVLTSGALKSFNNLRRGYGTMETNFKDVISQFQVEKVKSNRIVSDSQDLADPWITVHWTVRPKSTIPIQYCVYSNFGLYKLIPQILVVSSTLEICLMHYEDPIMCFVPGGIIKLSSVDIKKSFNDIEEYKNYFQPLIQLESLTECLQAPSDMTLIIPAPIEGDGYSNAALKFIRQKYHPTQKNELFGILTIPEALCKDKGIFSSEISKFHMQIESSYENLLIEARTATGQDLLCIRGKLTDTSSDLPEICYWTAHAVTVSDGIIGTKNEEQYTIVFLLTQYDWTISNVDLDRVEFHIDFFIRSIVSKRQIQVLDGIQNHPFVSSVILGNVPKDHPRGDLKLDEYNAKFKLNHKQSVAVEKGLSEKLSLIWGPPGSGKTNIGCCLSLIYCLINKEDNDKRMKEYQMKLENPNVKNPIIPRKYVMLYCGPSNDCVDLVTREMQKKFTECPRLLRIYGKNQEVSDFPIPGIYLGECHQLTEEMKSISLHHIIRKSNQPKSQSIRLFDQYFAYIFNGQNDEANELFKESFIDNIERKYSDKALANLKSTIHYMKIEYEKEIAEAKQLYIEQSDVQMVLCTVSVTAVKIMNCFHFRQVIIDEAGMCKEPETLIPLIFDNKTEETRQQHCLAHVVLIGDHKQLRPIIKNAMAKNHGLEISLFERYQSLCPRSVTLLDHQYRMHPSICEFPSRQFYFKRLKCNISELWSGINRSDYQQNSPNQYNNWNGSDVNGMRYHKDLLKASNFSAIKDCEWPSFATNVYGFEFNCFNYRICQRCYKHKSECFTTHKGLPNRVLFYHVEGVEKNQPVTTADGNENSKYNKEEVDAVIKIYKRLLNRLNPKRRAPDYVTVLTQYKSQEKAIMERCKDAIKELSCKLVQPKVSTVIRSQGSENDYVIFSTVRSIVKEEDIQMKPTKGWENKNLGYITDPNQANVALTRAKKGLIIVGNSKLLRANYFWNELIKDLENRNAIIYRIDDFPFMRFQD